MSVKAAMTAPAAVRSRKNFALRTPLGTCCFRPTVTAISTSLKSISVTEKKKSSHFNLKAARMPATTSRLGRRIRERAVHGETPRGVPPPNFLTRESGHPKRGFEAIRTNRTPIWRPSTNYLQVFSHPKNSPLPYFMTSDSSKRDTHQTPKRDKSSLEKVTMAAQRPRTPPNHAANNAANLAENYAATALERSTLGAAPHSLSKE